MALCLAWALGADGAPPFPADLPDPLALPAPGQHGVRVLAPTLLELSLVTAKAPDRPPDVWDYVGPDGQPRLPDPPAFTVTVGGRRVAVTRVGFKRRPLYAPLRARDLRVANALYLELAVPVAEGDAVAVAGKPLPDGGPWTAVADRLRWSPAIHASQVGFAPDWPKKACVGAYLGSLGELPLAADAPFQIVDAVTGLRVHEGRLKPRADRGFTWPVPPYQQVAEADFSALRTPGVYRLAVPGLGASLPFRIDAGIPALLARTYALGLYHQRCGTGLALPFTRFTHPACHTAPAAVPADGFTDVQRMLADASADFDREPRHTAPQLKDLASALYPFVRTGTVDVSGGHHDAGDYSKYTVDSAALIHYLVFAVDVFPGAGALDNLGLPESGDGRSDLLQIAKWEADFLARMQDEDGGFYFLVGPRTRRYEDDARPQDGDPQAVFPKTTAATAAAAAALAQAGSSPLFRLQFPDDAARYLARARRGWDFLERAWARHGRRGAYQKLAHGADTFMDDDEVAWAATELYLATGDPKYHTVLLAGFDPAASSTMRWGWLRLADAYGPAIRGYACAAESGRRGGIELDAAHLRKCREQVLTAARDQAAWARACAYNTSHALESKRFRTAGWYFPTALAFDLAVACRLEARPEWLDAWIGNIDYECGGNPVNVTFLTGLGWRRQREIVHQWARNDERALPPDGIPLGALQTGFADIEPYRGELAALTFPSDSDPEAPYAFYDRWADTFNTTTEFAAAQQARALAGLAALMARGPARDAPWKSEAIAVAGAGATAPVGAEQRVWLEPPPDPAQGAQVVWEARDQEPALADAFAFKALRSGVQWVEAEVLWPDGRRSFAATAFQALKRPGGRPHVRGPTTRLCLDFDDWPDGAVGTNAGSRVSGRPRVSGANVAWMASPRGQALELTGFDDEVQVPVPAWPPGGAEGSNLCLSVWLYVAKWPYGRLSVPLLAFAAGQDDTIAGLHFDRWAQPACAFPVFADKSAARGADIAPRVRLGDWQHHALRLNGIRFAYAIDGQAVCEGEVANPRVLRALLQEPAPTVRVGHFIGCVDEVVLERGSG